MIINHDLKLEDLEKPLERCFQAASVKAKKLATDWDPAKGAPVFTVRGTYTSRGWTEWTQGFQFGTHLLLYDVLGDEEHLDFGVQATLDHMAPHVSHIGVHDHGFNNVSTYGNLRRLILEGRARKHAGLLPACEIALKVSGAIQAARWTTIADGTGYIHSFNGPQSLFVDTVRSCRSLVLAHALGHVLMGEGDRRFSLLERSEQHIRNTIKYNIYFGQGRDSYDTLPGRTVHESIFNTKDGAYRCPSTQQGYSPFSTWTRGLSWMACGAPEQVEFLRDFAPGQHAEYESELLRAAKATCGFFIDHGTAADGITYWDTGAPGLAQMPDWQTRPARIDNEHEPVDSSAAAITAQGLIRLGLLLGRETQEGRRFFQAGLTTAKRLLEDDYLSTDPNHHGLLLHSIYHRPNGWDHVPDGKKIPQGEACMWGDYHLLELAVLLHRLLKDKPYYTFYGTLGSNA
jgi:unsaturated chondroitin disaccharide hydrolase